MKLTIIRVSCWYPASGFSGKETLAITRRDDGRIMAKYRRDEGYRGITQQTQTELSNAELSAIVGRLGSVPVGVDERACIDGYTTRLKITAGTFQTAAFKWHCNGPPEWAVLNELADELLKRYSEGET